MTYSDAVDVVIAAFWDGEVVAGSDERLDAALVYLNDIDQPLLLGLDLGDEPIPPREPQKSPETKKPQPEVSQEPPEPQPRATDDRSTEPVEQPTAMPRQLAIASGVGILASIAGGGWWWYYQRVRRRLQERKRANVLWHPTRPR